MAKAARRKWGTLDCLLHANPCMSKLSPQMFLILTGVPTPSSELLNNPKDARVDTAPLLCGFRAKHHLHSVTLDEQKLT